MDKTKYIDELVTNSVAHTLKLVINTDKVIFDDVAWWKASGDVFLAYTRDGINWGEGIYSTTLYRKDRDSAYAAVLNDCEEYSSSVQFMEQILLEVIKAEEGGLGRSTVTERREEIEND